MSSRIRIGHVSSFDSSTWWGEIKLNAPGDSPVKFHATSFLGATTRTLPRVGERVKLVFSDEHGKKLVSVRSQPDA